VRAKDRKRLLFAIPAAVLIAGGVLAALISFRGPRSPAEATEVSGAMPRIDQLALQGGRVSPNLYDGKVVVVNMWASWCGPCRREQPGLERLWRRYRDAGVQFIGVDFKDDRAAALEYLTEFGVTYPSVSDPTGILAFRFGMLAPPTTFLVDRSGQMRYELLGAQAETTVRRHIDELLAEDVR
jgi:cytochrome c biogenesis protein CcmG/thiol:disulfide interchange protein DsbE